MSAGVTPASSNARGPGPHGAGVGQVDAAVVGVLRRLAVAEHLHARARSRSAGDLGRDDDQRAAAVGDHAAVEAVQRIADHRRLEHLLDGDRRRAGRRAGCAARGATPATLISASCALVVPNSYMCRRGGERVERRDGRARSGSRTAPRARRAPPPPPGGRPPVRGLPASVISATWHLPAAIARGGVADVDEVGRAAGLGRVDVAHAQAEVLGHGQAADAGRVAGAEVRVDVGQRQPGVGERAGATSAWIWATVRSGISRSGCS